MKIRSFILLLLAGVLWNACSEKDKEPEPKPLADLSSSTDNSLAENLWADVFKVLDDAAKQTPEVNKISVRDTCPSIIVDTTVVDTITLTIDFGTGCTSPIDLRTRKGKLIAHFIGRHRDSGTVILITPLNYFVNNFKVEGINMITTQGSNASGNLEFNVIVSNATITTPEKDLISWSCNRTYEWVDGENTPTTMDDVYLITGGANGINRDGRSFVVDITTPLTKEISCKHIVSGVLEITPQDLATRSIDYGTGICDGIVTFSVASLSWTITLP